MAWNDLKAAVAAVIKTNGTQAITGALLQSTLNSIIDQVGANSTFKGIAIPSTNPGTPDGPVFYLAATSGTYSNFGGFVFGNDLGLAVISNISGAWVGTKILSNLVDTSGNQQITGTKTFTIGPIVPVADSDNKAQNKAGVETQITARQETGRSQSTTKSPTSKLVDDEFNKTVSIEPKEFSESQQFQARKNISALQKSDIWVNTGKYLNAVGTIASSGVTDVTDYLLIDKAKDISLIDLYGAPTTPSICFYDKKKVFISGLETNGTYTISAANIPANTFFIRATALKTKIKTRDVSPINVLNNLSNISNEFILLNDYSESQAIQLLRSYNSLLVFSGFVNTSTPTPSNSANKAYIATENGTIFGISSVVKGQIIEDNGTAFSAKFITKCLLRNDIWVNTGKYLNAVGTIASSGVTDVTDYLLIDKAKDISLIDLYGAPTTPSICYYDVNKVFISSIETNGTYTVLAANIPSTAVYLRATALKTKIATRDVSLNYSENILSILSTNETRISNLEKNSFPSGKRITSMGDSITAIDSYHSAVITNLGGVNGGNYGVGSASWNDTSNVINLGTPTGSIDNTIANQVRRLIRETTALGAAITWTHPVESYTVTIPGYTGLGTKTAPDIIIIAAGTNGGPSADDSVNGFAAVRDYTYQQLCELTNKTLRASARWAVETLQIVYPNAVIFLATPLQANYPPRSYSSYINAAGLQLKEIAGLMACQIIDACNESGINYKFEIQNANGRYLSDGLHPNTAGKALMSKFFIKQIRNKYML